MLDEVGTIDNEGRNVNRHIKLTFQSQTKMIGCHIPEAQGTESGLRFEVAEVQEGKGGIDLVYATGISSVWVVPGAFGFHK